MGINAYGGMAMHRLGLPFIVALVTLIGRNFTIAKAKSAQGAATAGQVAFY